MFTVGVAHPWPPLCRRNVAVVKPEIGQRGSAVDLSIIDGSAIMPMPADHCNAALTRNTVLATTGV